MCGWQTYLVAVAVLLVGGLAAAEPGRYMPVIDGDWWQVAGNPDLGKYTTKRQQILADL